jgi:hypothetical protein
MASKELIMKCKQGVQKDQVIKDKKQMLKAMKEFSEIIEEF